MAVNDEKMLYNELLRERRKDRWFKGLKSLVWILVIVWGISAFAPDSIPDNKPALADDYANLVDLEGTILSDSKTASAEVIRDALEKAFSDESAKGVVIRVNSPGGSPVQADLIRRDIQRLKTEYDKKVVVVGEEMLTSGAYMASLSADKIYAHPSTLVGSIGVRMDGFGAVELIDKVGVQRRVFHAGENKVGVDPFLPVTEDTKSHIQSILADIHSQFINSVRQSRADKLADNDELMSGQFWTGQKSIELGLIDELGTVYDAIENEFGVHHYVAVEPDRNVLDRLAMFTSSIKSMFVTTSAPVRAQY